MWIMSSIALCVPLAVGGGQTPPNEGMAPAVASLRPGDALRITVFRNTELSGEFVVALDGSLRHPLYRGVQVAGIPLPSVETQLRAFIRRFVTADSLLVIEPLFRVAVGGDVVRPNVYTLPPETSIAQAVALAGGPTERGRRDRVLLVRDGSQTAVDLRGARAEGRTLVRSGDEILVERQRSAFRDVIAPAATLLGATAAIINVFLYNRR